MERQELFQRAVMLQRQSEETEQQLKFVEEQIAELEKFKEGLKNLRESKEKEILANLGKGVYVKSEIKDREKLFVEVGAGVIVKKTPGEAMRVVEEQTARFENARVQISEQLEVFTSELQRMIGEIEKLKEG